MTLPFTRRSIAPSGHHRRSVGSAWLTRIEAEDFVGMRREQGAPDLLRAAEAAVAATRPDDGRLGLVHGDLWYGNTLWHDSRLTAVLDWDCVGVGPGGRGN